MCVMPLSANEYSEIKKYSAYTLARHCLICDMSRSILFRFKSFCAYVAAVIGSHYDQTQVTHTQYCTWTPPVYTLVRYACSAQWKDNKLRKKPSKLPVTQEPDSASQWALCAGWRKDILWPLKKCSETFSAEWFIQRSYADVNTQCILYVCIVNIQQ